jgi:hypothetical protein
MSNRAKVKHICKSTIFPSLKQTARTKVRAVENIIEELRSASQHADKATKRTRNGTIDELFACFSVALELGVSVHEQHV